MPPFPVAETWGWLRDVGTGAGSVTAIILFFVLLSKIPPVKWVTRNVLGKAWRAVVSEPLAGWFRVQVRHEVTAAVTDEVGPLMSTQLAPVLDRLSAVEEQMKPNGGKTLRDRVDALAAQVGCPPPFDS